ncbi:hypothetical protein [Saccharibacillus sacchari]|uniref:Uncharacterized protein n=1 Tax=Saccharibacillus sacchari DSM 19268 TaxID=915437 RepID=A0A010YT42_9BACL|nr:hypothetical protein [Saccharibacillus sacchari]EXG83335.1 hypothetical protein SacsacDRAFT_0302 [Saccharibacillus sacchari DSM 19268]
MTAVQTTRDELSLIKSYLLLTHILKTFENDAKKLESDTPTQTSTLYTEMIRNASRCAAVLLSGIRREFKKRSIRMCEVQHSEKGVDADYLCRGLHGTMHIDHAPFHNEMELRMRAYLGISSTENRSAEPIVTDSGRQSAAPVRNYGHRTSKPGVSAKKKTSRPYSAGAYA